MKHIVTLPRNKSDHRAHPRPDTGKKILVHYSLDGRVVCEATLHLTTTARFIELPLPVIHQMTRGKK